MQARIALRTSFILSESVVAQMRNHNFVFLNYLWFCFLILVT